jgi:protein-ribulosamine 3-kinase
VISAPLANALERRWGCRVVRSRRLTGGDINEAFSVELSSGARWFVKTNERAPATLFTAEARGLEWLRSASAIRVPKVHAVSEPGEGVNYLVLELIESARPAPDFDETLGRELAALHRAAPAGFGLDHDNFIGSLPQPNQPTESWAEFYRRRRLEPLLERAVKAGALSYAVRLRFDRLFSRLPELLPPSEPPSRLHGDLWGGNLHVDERGAPCLIDPAVYGGHREVDLAMMKLFGGFSARVFAAYDEAFPLAPGASERVELFQIYPLLVHVNLFGGSYAGSVERALSRYT